MKLGINSIYRATEGEGIHIGESQMFVRFQGCNIGCLNCDSKDTWDFSAAQMLDLEDVLNKIEELSKTDYFPLKRVSITGGDPLHPKHEESVLSLVKALKQQDYYINIEASGSRICDEIFNLVDFISFDFKTPSTGVQTSLTLVEKALVDYHGKIQIKSVIASDHDFYYTQEAFEEISKNIEIKDPWCLTPAYTPGEEFTTNFFSKVLVLNQQVGGKFKVIGQQHKWVYGADKKQV